MQAFTRSVILRFVTLLPTIFVLERFYDVKAAGIVMVCATAVAWQFITMNEQGRL